MGNPLGWLLCINHTYVNITALTDLRRGAHLFQCMRCGKRKEELMAVAGNDDDPVAAQPLHTVITKIDTVEGCVRLSVWTHDGEPLHVVRYTPETARALAQQLTVAAYHVEDLPEGAA